MKTRLGLFFAALLTSTFLCSQTHITIDNPDTWSGESLRAYIGQTVVFDVPMVVCANANGNYVVSPWRRMQPESCGVTGSADYKSAVRINNSCMFSIAGISGYHRCGEKIIGLKARVNSTNSLTMSGGTWHGNTRAELEAGIPDLGDYRLLVCAFNLENYYMTWGSMGARSYAEHQDQRAKISKALKRINADIYGLVELQIGNEAIGEIVGDLNKNLPDRNYRYFADATSGTDQAVGLVYDANTVQPVGTPVETDVELKYRKKMVCFQEIATGERFIYSINHFKAMNSGDEERRVNEAKAVIKLYNQYRQNNSIRDKDVLFMGDMNSYAFARPILAFTDNGYIDLHRAFHADSSYSYMFGGLASYIDHAITNGTLYGQITGMAGYHINSDEDDRYTYDKSSDLTMFRCSDHDPVLVGLKLDSTLLYDPTPQINSREVVEGNAHKLVIQNAYKEGQPAYCAVYSLNGWLFRREQITSPLYEMTLPEQQGVYIVYVYYDGVAYQRKMIVR